MPESNNHQSLERRLKSLTKIGRRSTREDVLNVFTPNNVVINSAKFAGRGKPLEQMMDALLAEGADMIVFGERGSGKSSLAHMLHNVAWGDSQILEYYGLREYLERKGFLSWLIGPSRKKFNVIWVDGFSRSLDEVIRAVLTRRREDLYGPGLLSYLKREADQVEISSKIGFDKIFTAESELKEIFVPEKPVNIKEGFEIAMQRYADQHQDELLIIIDEFETVKERAEISQYLKSVKRARFVLVGIAATTLELIGQHASVARDTHAIELLPMSEDELELVLDIGSHILSPYCTYSAAGKAEIVRSCHGSPYWCHFLAKALLQEKLESAGSFERFMDLEASPPLGRDVTSDDVQALLGTLPSRAECKIYEEALKQITMADETTARVLRGIARGSDSIISSTVAATSLESEERITKDVTAETIDGILKMRDSPFEERGRIRNVVSFSFRDPNFKRYILMRNAGLPSQPRGRSE